MAIGALALAAAPVRAETASAPGAPAQAATAPPPAKRAALREGEPAPWIAAFDLNGDPRSLARILGQKGVRGAVVALWASWCKPCRRELELLVAGRERLRQQGIELFLVNLREDAAVVQVAVNELKLQGIPLVIDATGAIAEQVGAASPGRGATDDLALPLSFVVAARETKVKRVWAGAASDTIVDDAIALLASELVRGR